MAKVYTVALFLIPRVHVLELQKFESASVYTDRTIHSLKQDDGDGFTLLASIHMTRWQMPHVPASCVWLAVRTTSLNTHQNSAPSRNVETVSLSPSKGTLCPNAV